RVARSGVGNRDRRRTCRENLEETAGVDVHHVAVRGRELQPTSRVATALRGSDTPRVTDCERGRGDRGDRVGADHRVVRERTGLIETDRAALRLTRREGVRLAVSAHLVHGNEVTVLVGNRGEKVAVNSNRDVEFRTGLVRQVVNDAVLVRVVVVLRRVVERHAATEVVRTELLEGRGICKRGLVLNLRRLHTEVKVVPTDRLRRGLETACACGVVQFV